MKTVVFISLVFIFSNAFSSAIQEKLYINRSSAMDTYKFNIITTKLNFWMAQNSNDQLSETLGPINHSFFTETDSLWVFAGNDTTICLNSSSFPIIGEAINYWYLAWSTTGDGFFSDANKLNTNYYPGFNDTINGQVRLVLTIYPAPPEIQSLADTVSITMVPAPLSNAGINGEICEQDHFQLSGQVFHSSSVLWTTTGDGYFDNPEVCDAIYFPGEDDITEGETVLCLIAFPDNPCVMPTADCLILYINKLPVIHNLNDTVICQNSQLLLNPTVLHCDSVEWTTSGDGFFSNQYLVNPVYFPGEQDITNGEAELQLMAVSGFVCNTSVSVSMTLTIQSFPTVYQVPDQTVCAGDTIFLEGGGSNYATICWMSFGDGSFNDPYILNPEYYPGLQDLERGKAYLEIYATAIVPCVYSTGSYVEITINDHPQVFAGEDVTGCSNIQLNASASNYSSLIWETSGDGIFSDINVLNPSYSAGTQDITNGQVSLLLTALPLTPCLINQTDQLFFYPDNSQVLIHNVTDQTLTAGEDLQLSFVVQSLLPGIYTWFHNNQEVINQNLPDLIINSVGAVNAGFYHCTYENECGILKSDTGLIAVLEPASQSLFLPGGWSGFSLYFQPNDPNINSILSPIAGQVIMLMNFEGIYWPSGSINTLGVFDHKAGYAIKLSQDVTLTIEGMVKYPADPVLIDPGWSFLPVLSGCTISVEQVFGSLPQILIIKEVSGTDLYWPQMLIFTLEYLIPGNSYFIFNSGETAIEITFPECIN